MKMCRAQFLLTEVGHGLDARNLEMTATLKPDGGFELHTPHPGAAKYDSLTYTSCSRSC
jgi:alkylation response protein AidB-like acyl-CoA dehydrogenase